MRKNLAKIDFFNGKIEELTKLLGDAKPAETRKKADKVRKPYQLSKWDNIILDVIRENGKPATSKEIYQKTMAMVAKTGIAMEEGKMKSKINQCLVKLTNRRHDLKKLKVEGRGFAYAIV